MNTTARELDFLSPELVEEGRPPSMLRGVLRTTEGKVGLALGVFMLALIILGPFIAPYPPTQIAAGPPASGPSAAHLLGTDPLGRDMLSRFLTGGRSVLLVPLAAVLLSLGVGGALGMLGAYRPGTPDQVIVRGFDLVMALPALLIVLVLIAGLGTSVMVVILTVALVFAPRMGRVVRGAAQSVVLSDYVSAAQLRGESTGWILGRELLPNVAGPVLATFALYLTYAIIFVATLSFLGLGAQPPSSDWGLMVAESRSFFALNPWATLAPALGIAALSVAFTLLADAVNRHLSRGTDRPETAV